MLVKSPACGEVGLGCPIQESVLFPLPSYLWGCKTQE